MTLPAGEGVAEVLEHCPRPGTCSCSLTSVWVNVTQVGTVVGPFELP